MIYRPVEKKADTYVNESLIDVSMENENRSFPFSYLSEEIHVVLVTVE